MDIYQSEFKNLNFAKMCALNFILFETGTIPKNRADAEEKEVRDANAGKN